MTLHLPFILLDPKCRPIRKTYGAIGWDLVARLDQTVWIPQGQTVKIPVGIRLDLPAGYEAQVRPRSGMTLRGHRVTLGTIDSDFRGEILVPVYNTQLPAAMIEPYMAIAQMVIAPVLDVEWVEVDSISETARGESGWGSTDRKLYPHCVTCNKVIEDCGCDGWQGVYYKA